MNRPGLTDDDWQRIRKAAEAVRETDGRVADHLLPEGETIARQNMRRLLRRQGRFAREESA